MCCETGYQFSSRFCRILLWLGFDLMKYVSSNEGSGKANPKLGMKILWVTNLGEKTSLIPFFYHVHCFDPDFSFRPQFWGKYPRVKYYSTLDFDTDYIIFFRNVEIFKIKIKIQRSFFLKENIESPRKLYLSKWKFEK
jgi:hypothetical protein